MRPPVRVAFALFWPGFTPDTFRDFFPYVHEKYDIVSSATPDVVFYSVFTLPVQRVYADPRHPEAMPTIRPGDYVRVFFTGENVVPVMERCEFAISFALDLDHPNHLRLPLWVYENRPWGYGPEQLVKDADTDWEKIGDEKTKFCNYVYANPVSFREEVFRRLSKYKHVDAAGRCSNNMNGWTVPRDPNRLAGKLEFLKQYKFTLAMENALWPGYMTEKIIDPIYVNSIPIYVGDPQARRSFNPESYIDYASLGSIREMLEFVREVDNSRDLYLEMLAAPFYRNNAVPEYAREDRILAFFDRVFEAALARKG
jgi:alpha(1,3/1,4) fucosyltransferase